MTMDIFTIPKDLEEEIEDTQKKAPHFHHYDPKELVNGENLSANVPNFIVLIAVSLCLYETNELNFVGSGKKKVHRPLFEYGDDNEKYIILSNSYQKKEMFHLGQKAKSRKAISYDDNEFEIKYRENHMKGWFKKQTKRDYVKDLQLQFYFVKLKDRSIDDPKGRVMFTAFDLATQIFCCPVNWDHPFFQMDSSFISIMMYLQDKIYLKEWLRTPGFKINDISGRSKVKIDIEVIFGKPNSTTPKNPIKKDSVVVQQRPKAVQYNTVDKKRFLQAVQARENKFGTNSVNFTNAVYDNAHVYAEKCIELILLAKVRENMKSEVNERDLSDMNKLAQTAIFNNAAGRLVAHIKTALSSDELSEKIGSIIDEKVFSIANVPEQEKTQDDQGRIDPRTFISYEADEAGKKMGNQRYRKILSCWRL
jgi:hypothetical protein